MLLSKLRKKYAYGVRMLGIRVTAGWESLLEQTGWDLLLEKG